MYKPSPMILRWVGESLSFQDFSAMKITTEMGPQQKPVGYVDAKTPAYTPFLGGGFNDCLIFAPKTMKSDGPI